MTVEQTGRDPSAGDPTGEAAVRVSSLQRSFGGLTVLDGLSFELPTGSVTCVVGSNGSGKSTLLRIVAGLLAADAGTVAVERTGERPIGYLAQHPSFRPQFTVGETLEFYGGLLESSVDVDAVLERVGLGPVADRRVAALSGGMVRLLGIAQATVGDPRVMLLDEPSSGLDPTMTRRVGDVIDGLGTDDRSVLLATHDLDTAERVADQVLVLEGGEIAARGPPEELAAVTDSESLTAAIPDLFGKTGNGTVSAGTRTEDES